MPRNESYFSKDYSNLRENYTDKSGEYRESCALIALGFANVLKKEGKNTNIIAIYGEIVDSSGRRKPLVPALYNGRIQWGNHVVCESDGVIYDPIFESPMQIEEYLATAFNQDVDIIKLNS